jgi:hypothetical protein
MYYIQPEVRNVKVHCTARSMTPGWKPDLQSSNQANPGAVLRMSGQRNRVLKVMD